MTGTEELIARLEELAAANCPNDMGFDRETGPIGCRLDSNGCGCLCAVYVLPVREAASALRLLSDEVAALRQKLEAAREALNEVASPIGAMRRRAEAAGATLDGHMAVTLANDVGYLQGIARAALTTLESPDA